MSKEWNPDDVLDVFGCEIAREILTLASRQAMSADELADRCGVSPPTVYRRIDALQEYDMLEECVEVDDAGHHYRTFHTAVEELRFRVEEGGYDVELRPRRDYTDRLADLWGDLERGAEERPERPSRDRDGAPSDG